MAIINCKKCGKKISDLSEKCIHCGVPIEEIKTTDDLKTNNKKRRV